jgi:hypothetical protein
VQNFGFDVITLLVHTFHALQPLNVNCLKPFKSAFKIKKPMQWLETLWTKQIHNDWSSEHEFGPITIQKKSQKWVQSYKNLAYQFQRHGQKDQNILCTHNNG